MQKQRAFSAHHFWHQGKGVLAPGKESHTVHILPHGVRHNIDPSKTSLRANVPGPWCPKVAMAAHEAGRSRMLCAIAQHTALILLISLLTYARMRATICEKMCLGSQCVYIRFTNVLCFFLKDQQNVGFKQVWASH